MVARPGTYLASNNSGELKPELHGRTDLKQFYGGLAYARNVEPVPQGGSRLSPRTRHLGRVRRRLFTLTPSIAEASVTGITTAATLHTLDLGTAQQVSVVSAQWITASQQIGAILQIQYWDGAAWINFGAPFSAGQRRTLRSAVAAPGAPITTTAVRLQLLAAPPSSTDFSFGLFAWGESNDLSAARIVPFTFSLDQTYTAVVAGLHVDFYRDGVFVGGALTYLTEDRIAEATYQQRLDTMLVFHQDQSPMRVIRDGRDDRWSVDVVPFTNIPQVDLGGTYSNAIVDIWKVYIRVIFDPDSFFDKGVNLLVSFTVNGEETGPIGTGPAADSAGNPDWSAFAAAVKAAIENLPSVENTVDVTGAVGIGAGEITISFTGDGQASSANIVAAQVVNTTDGAATASHFQRGQPGGELLMNDARGYPTCAQFYQDRLTVGGFRSKRGALLASVTGEYFNLNINLNAASGAILANLDTDGAERILALVRSRHLVIFTSDAEYYISDRALSKNAVPTIVNSSRNGIARGIAPVESEGSMLYASRNNAVLYAATYDDVSTAYVSTPISLLASHIASDISAMAIQKASTSTDAGRLWLPRLDGTMTLGTMLRGESITAFTRWHTDGLVRSVTVDGKNVAHLLVERTSGARQELHLERLELGLIFDAAIEQTFTPARTNITGLAAHEGAQVWALADGYVEGPFTVSGGAIDIQNASSHVIVGRWTPPIVDTLPLPSEISERVVLRRPKRVHTVKLDLVDTTSIAVGANGQAPRDIALGRVGDPIDAPQAPVNRTINVTGLRGFSDDGKVRITQTKPGQLAWRGITIEART